MKTFYQSMKDAFADSFHYLNILPFKYWMPLLITSVFIGWNGLQIFFSPNLILAFVNTRSITQLVYTTLEFNLRSIPIYMFIIITIVFIHWFLHSLFEIGFTHMIHHKKIKPTAIYATGLNFFIPNLLIVAILFFVIASLFMFSIFIQILFSGFTITFFPGMEMAIYRVVALTVLLSIMVTMWLTDFVLPRMALGLPFREAMLRSIVILNLRPVTMLSFYVIKLLLIIASMAIFQMFLRHLLLPFFVMLEVRYSFSIFLISSRSLVFENIFFNLQLLFFVFLGSLIVFAPIMAPFYIFHRYLLYRLTKV